MSDTDTNWERIKELLYQALQRPPEQRQLFLDSACGSDAVLRAEIESLLSSEALARPNFLEPPPINEPDEEALVIAGAGALAEGQIFAERFVLKRRLGEGGMGQVWLAEQTAPVRRQVALKLIKAGMYDEELMRRFIAERQSLAIMDHPSIAKVFDAGATPQGQPYFVMEYVPGLPIVEYCDQHRLDIRARLELFIQACEGVQHAHLKAVIHRDIKPANVLVIEVDGKPVPRIIDFGLAKASTSPLPDQTQHTRVGLFLGTPGYMSPEQVNPGLKDIDTRTDVYSLGVVLYVLLTGLEPYERKHQERPPLEEWLRQLREDEPPSPSAKLSADRDTATANSRERGTEANSLVKLLRGDLDWITMKALERDRERRYSSAAELAADLRRFLDHEPVIARPASRAYRLGKYVRRHRVAAAVAGGLLVLLAGFSVLQALELRRTTQERDRANRERDRATRVTDFMVGMFKVADPSEARGNSVTAREVLDKASQDIGTNLTQEPEVQAQMMQVMAQTYMNLGLYARADGLAKRALDARMRLHGPDDRKTLESMSQLGAILGLEGQLAGAEKLERQALAGERRVLGAAAPLTLETMGELGFVRQKQTDYGESEKLERGVIELGTPTLGPDNEVVLRARNTLGLALVSQARYVEGEQQFRQFLDSARRVWGPDHPQTLYALGNLAYVLHVQGRLAEAEPLYRDNLTARLRTLGPDHPSTLIAEEDLATLLAVEGRLAEADKMLREVLTTRTRVLGPEHSDTLNARSNFAELLLNEGHIQEAEKMQRETLAIQARVFGAASPYTLISQSGLAATLIKEEHYLEAEKLAREAFDIEIKSLGAQHPNTQDALLQLGKALAYTHRYPEAIGLFRGVIDGEENSQTPRGDRWSTWYSFASVALAADDPDDALRYLNEAVSRGYKDGDRLLADDDLAKLRPNPKFQHLIADLKHVPPSGNQQ